MNETQQYLKTATKIELLENENWVEIENTRKKYFLSDYGRVISFAQNKCGALMKGTITKKGYVRLTIKQNGKRKDYLLHRLVAMYFIENDNPEVKITVDHINENKLCNKAENLQWLSIADNVKLYHQRKKYKERGNGIDNIKSQYTKSKDNND